MPTAVSSSQLLLLRLKAWRAARSKSVKQSPASLLSDGVLSDIASLQPLSILELTSVQGLAPRKVRAGHCLLLAVGAHMAIC